ncbi:hypothetical protein Tco_1263628 [Tanacetum coccineum]
MVRGKLRQLPSGEYRDGLQIANMDKITVHVPMIPSEPDGSTQAQSTSTSNEVSVCTEGVKECKINVKIKGEKKAALLKTLGRNRVTAYAVRIIWLIANIEDKYHGPRIPTVAAAGQIHVNSQPLAHTSYPNKAQLYGELKDLQHQKQLPLL